LLVDEKKVKEEKKLKKKMKEIEKLQLLTRELNEDEKRKLESKDELLR
jgi:hypothetical protein